MAEIEQPSLEAEESRAVEDATRSSDGATQTPPDDAGQAPPDDPVQPSSHDAAPSADAAQIEGDLDELVGTAAQRDEYLALAQRTQADFENYRKRVAKETAAAQARGAAKLAKELLPALDNLDRALADADGSPARGGEDDPLLEGVRLVRTELHAALARVGIESFSPEGETFDPAKHEAMATRPAPDAHSGAVVEVYQPGYRLGEQIIRPARVVVAA
jgi:molecular chaperone GrpE